MVVDLIVLAFIILFIIIGFFRGFLRELISLLGFVGSLVISYFSYEYFADFLNNLFGWGIKISEYIMTQITGISASFGTETGETVEQLKNIINNSGSGGIYVEILKKIVEKANFSAGSITVSGAVGDIVSNIAMSFIAAVILFILLRIVVFIINKLLSKIPRKSVVGVANKWLGVIFGAIKGAAFVVILLGVAYLLCLVPSINEVIYPYIQNTYVTKHIYNYLGELILSIGFIG